MGSYERSYNGKLKWGVLIRSPAPEAKTTKRKGK